MKWSEIGFGGPLLFATYFILFAFEYFYPLVRKKTNHHKVNFTATAVLIAINLLFTSITLGIIHWTQNADIGLFNMLHLSPAIEVLVSIVFLDFWSGYISHVVFHKYEILWPLHVVHHSDDHVDVTTTFRQHPIESIIKIGFNILALILLGITPWIFALYLTLSTLHSQFEHANVQLPRKLDRILQLILVTPNMHKVHHSKYQHETDSNYSNIFSIWDRLFGTYTNKNNYKAIEYGLDFLPSKTSFTFWQLLTYPFAFRKLKRRDASSSDSIQRYKSGDWEQKFTNQE